MIQIFCVRSLTQALNPSENHQKKTHNIFIRN
jgi:hypothetical protein